jgi:hypothetical protein
MNFFKYIFKSKNKFQNAAKEVNMRELLENKENRKALIQNGRQQFKKLQELGLQIPIAAL